MIITMEQLLTVFCDVDATIQYHGIITNAVSDNRAKGSGVYFESHHIIPKSLGGHNGQGNRVLLTAKEHFTCHQLLTHMTTGLSRSKMCRALFRMIHGNRQQRMVPIDADEYAALREQISTQMSRRFKGTTIPDERKQRISESKKGNMSEEHKAAISAAHRGKEPWNKGKTTSDEVRERISQAKTGKARGPLSEDTKQKMADAKRGRKPWNAGVSGYSRQPQSEEAKQKIRESRLRTEQLKRERLLNEGEMPSDVPHE